MISDDRAARSVARPVRVELHGTGYVLERMHREAHLSREEAVSKVGEMRRAGWRISEDDYRDVLDYLRRL